MLGALFSNCVPLAIVARSRCFPVRLLAIRPLVPEAKFHQRILELHSNNLLVGLNRLVADR